MDILVLSGTGVVTKIEEKTTNTGKRYYDIAVSSSYYAGEGKGYNGGKYDNMPVYMKYFVSSSMPPCQKGNKIAFYAKAMPYKNNANQHQLSYTANSITVLEKGNDTGNGYSAKSTVRFDSDMPDEDIPF